MSIRFEVLSLVRGLICIAFVTLAGCGSGGGDGTGNPTSVVDAAPDPGVATGSELPTLRISEVVARNESSLDDDDGHAEDWLEIENTGTEAIDLAGIYLTDDADVLDQWAFGSGVLPGGERLVIFASSKDRSVAPYHTNFSLKGDGEFLAIVDRDGATVIDRIGESYPAQFTDISYGLDDAGGYRYFNQPTPGQANSTSGYAGFLEVEFSRQRGFESTPFILELLASDAAALVRYTLDGTEPDENIGKSYSGPIAINTTTVVRAFAYQSGYLSALPQTHTYVFPNEVVEQPWSITGYPNPSYPVGGNGGSVIHDHQMDPAITQSPAYAADLISGLTEIPTVSLALAPSTLFGDSGFYDTNNTEVPVSMEILYADAPDENQQVNAGIESHSHLRLKRSMRINLRSEYGFSKLESDILQHAPVNGDSAADEFDRLILRAGNNRAWTRNWNRDRTTFTVDQFYRDTQIAASGTGSHGNFVHVYINGIYWGMHNLAERPDAKFMAEYLGGNDDDWFFIKHGSAGDGDKSRYESLEVLLDGDLSVAANYETLQRHLDTGKYIDYILIAFYTSMSDWPQNNFYGGNRSDDSPLGATPFRFFAWDGEWSWDRQHQNVPSNPGGQARVHPMFKASASLDDSAPLAARIWHAARRNASFMSELRQRVDQLTGAGGALSDAAATTRWQTLNAYVRNAVVAESARWGDALQSLDGRTRTRDDDWQPAVNVMAGLIDGNAAALRQALASEGFY